MDMFSYIIVPLLDFLSHSAAPKTMKFASHSFSLMSHIVMLNELLIRSNDIG